MNLKEIMTSKVEIIHPDDTLQHAAQKMRDLDIGFLPVMEDGELIGVITDRDLVIRAMVDNVRADTMVGRNLITAPAIACFDNQDVSDAMRLMKENNIRRLVVLSHDDENVVGVVSLGDVAANSDPSKSGEVLQSVSSRPVMMP